MPCVRPLHQLTLFVAIPFLDLADKLVIDPCDLLQVIIRKLPPLPFQIAFELHPFSFELISVHFIPPPYAYDGHSGPVITPENHWTADSLSGYAARAVRPLNT